MNRAGRAGGVGSRHRRERAGPPSKAVTPLDPSREAISRAAPKPACEIQSRSRDRSTAPNATCNRRHTSHRLRNPAAREEFDGRKEREYSARRTGDLRPALGRAEEGGDAGCVGVRRRRAWVSEAEVPDRHSLTYGLTRDCDERALSNLLLGPHSCKNSLPECKNPKG